MDVQALLKKLRIEDVNAGACYGPDGWLLDKKGAEIVSFNPANGERIASVMQASDAHYDQVVAEAQASFATWRDLPAPKRGDIVRQMGNAFRELKEPLGDLISLEMGKIRAEGHGEVQEVIDICDFAVGQSRQLYGLSMHSERPHHRMYEQWHPLGVVGVITAFNFPMAVWAWNAMIAGIAGDTVVWKPSELTPLSAVALQHICNDVMADNGLSGVFNLLVGYGKDTGQAMLEDPRIPLISFTGSIPTGRHVARTVAERFGRTILELGGNNAIIVHEDADLDLAVRAILFGAVGTAGQRCTTTRRILMHAAIADELTGKLVRAYEQVRIGDPLAADTLMGPLVTPKSTTAMFNAIEEAQKQGGEVLTGAEKLDKPGDSWVKPTIIRMPAQSEIVKQETFAPILYLLEYGDIEEAIALHNGVPQGLSSAIFTDSMRTVERFLSVGGSDCGIANVNIGTSGAEIGGAFGGEKETGGGRESGSDAWKAYMRRQTNTINWSTELPLAQGIEFSAD
jgi:aldehyde dehydrogenase (NAD+)